MHAIFDLALSDRFKQIDPSFPKISYMVHVLIAAGHVVVGISWHAVRGCPC